MIINEYVCQTEFDAQGHHPFHRPGRTQCAKRMALAMEWYGNTKEARAGGTEEGIAWPC